MAFTSVVFKNPATGAVKKAPVGFSWTVLFFWFLPPLLRGDWKWALVMLSLAPLTFGLSNILFIFIYNQLYIGDLIVAGYKVQSIADDDLALVREKLGTHLPLLAAA